MAEPGKRHVDTHAKDPKHRKEDDGGDRGDDKTPSSGTAGSDTSVRIPPTNDRDGDS